MRSRLTISVQVVVMLRHVGAAARDAGSAPAQATESECAALAWLVATTTTRDPLPDNRIVPEPYHDTTWPPRKAERAGHMVRVNKPQPIVAFALRHAY